MKKLILLLSFAVAMTIIACKNSSTGKEQSEALDTTKMKTGDAYYQCEMHPEVISDKPGKCSKCDMDLEKKEKK
ncbi:MAG: hypothetical protein HY063_15455 [Bacteroidetes bacterium]|nr:hypothetical protein [Bacteroidota bacterium]